MTRTRAPHAARDAARWFSTLASAVMIVVALVSSGPHEMAAQAVSQPPAHVDRPRLLIRFDSGLVNVGDPVTLHVAAQLPAGTRLVDATPLAREPLPDGSRIVHTDPLHLAADGSGSGTITALFFRPGAARIPPLAVTYRVTPDASVDTLVAAAVAVTVTPLVPIASGSLRDIKDIDAAPIPPHIAATAAALALAVLAIVAVAGHVRRRRRSVSTAARDLAISRGMPGGPYDTALARLAAISDDWAGRGDVDSHYALTADVLRRYLYEAHGIPALERTTPELLVVLPPPLATPQTRAATGDLLAVADLVKFARYDPRPSAPSELVSAARSVLAAWNTADPSAADVPATTDLASVARQAGPAGGERHAIR